MARVHLPGSIPGVEPVPPPRSPEQLARELEERVRGEAQRAAAWRARRRWRVVLALLAGTLLPATAVAAAGGIAAGSLADWLGSDAGRWSGVWAGLLGLAPAALMAWLGLGALAGVVAYGAAFGGFVALAGDGAGALLPLLVLLLALFVASGALVGSILAQGDG